MLYRQGSGLRKCDWGADVSITKSNETFNFQSYSNKNNKNKIKIA